MKKTGQNGMDVAMATAVEGSRRDRRERSRRAAIVIDPARLPTRLPLTWTVLAWLLLDRLQPPAWVWGAVWSFVATTWLVALSVIGREVRMTPKFFDDVREDGK